MHAGILSNPADLGGLRIGWDTPAFSRNGVNSAVEVDLASMGFPLHGDESLELAEANLIAAEGLPGADFDRSALLTQVDSWAELVRLGIHRTSSEFTAAPHEYENSWAYFRVLIMITVLQRNLGVRYRVDLMQDPVDWSDSRTRFIHGPLTGFGGTCASLPVLYVAIGRRLGWPLYLVGAKQHLFVRWQDERERFNIEGSSQGFVCHPDEFYHTWPLPISQKEIDRGWYLRNFTPSDEQANCMHDRAICQTDNMQWAEALKSAFAAMHLSPRDPNCCGTHSIAMIHAFATAGHAFYECVDGTGELTRVHENGRCREPEKWEKWAAPLAKKDYARIAANHRASGKPLPQFA